jgi:hypothetical protein
MEFNLINFITFSIINQFKFYSHNWRLK